jgi:NAD(P)H-dependent flavin oxidoreductase YrpB (nitropropane dioxygenase family)
MQNVTFGESFFSAVVDICAGKKSSFMQLPVAVVAAGGIYDGRGLAMSLCYGAQVNTLAT